MQRAVPPIVHPYARILARGGSRSSGEFRKEAGGSKLRFRSIVPRVAIARDVRARACVRKGAASRGRECDDRWLRRILLIRAAATLQPVAPTTNGKGGTPVKSFFAENALLFLLRGK